MRRNDILPPAQLFFDLKFNLLIKLYIFLYNGIQYMIIGFEVVLAIGLVFPFYFVALIAVFVAHLF
jgi:hypothetical protein